MFRLAIIPLLLNFITLYPQESKLDSQFHKERRDEVRKKMPENSVAVFFSSPIRNRSNSVDFLYHQDRNFYYLTGWREPHGVLLIYKNQQEDEEDDSLNVSLAAMEEKLIIDAFFLAFIICSACLTVRNIPPTLVRKR